MEINIHYSDTKNCVKLLCCSYLMLKQPFGSRVLFSQTLTVTIYGTELIVEKLFDLNENAAKHLRLHLDPSKVTQSSHELYATKYYSI